MPNCNTNLDSLKLVREGTSQVQRPFPALDPAFVPADGRTTAHGMVFAQALSGFLKYYDLRNVALGNWQDFFGKDVSLQLAVASIQDVDEYRQSVKEYFDFLNEILHNNASDAAACKEKLGFLFSCVGTLAVRLDKLTVNLPDDFQLKATLRNAINSQLAPQFKQLLGYYLQGISLGLIAVNTAAPIPILGNTAMPFRKVYDYDFSDTWRPKGAAQNTWATFRASITPILNAFGTGSSVFEQINHLSTHNLFTAIFDQFLKTYSRLVSDAKAALEASFTNYNQHDPHYALFLAFLKLMEHARAETNSLTARHLDFYYKEILQLRARSAQPGHAHLLIELAKHAQTHELPSGELFKAGADALGKDVFFANNRNFVANKAKVAALKTIYLHDKEPVGKSDINDSRMYAAPVANSEDGFGADLLSADKSWHPFFNKIYQDGELTKINMPVAEVGFAVASHYLWMAEGTRTITLDIAITGGPSTLTAADFECFFTTEKGWLSKIPASPFTANANESTLTLTLELSGADPSITPYLAKTHGYTFDTPLPMVLVKLKHDATIFAYTHLQNVKVLSINLTVNVVGLRSLAVSNDFGPVDTAKPFQPFGASPVQNNALIVGSKEVFQKTLSSATINIQWQTAPAPFNTRPTIKPQFLNAGIWTTMEGLPNPLLNTTSIALVKTESSINPTNNEIDLSESEMYVTESRNGFVRVVFNGDFGQTSYQSRLLAFLRKNKNSTDPGKPPIGPFISSFSLNYVASQSIVLNNDAQSSFENRTAKFFHLAPFGHAEQQPYLKSQSTVKDKAIYLLPQLKSIAPMSDEGDRAELLIGITDLKPPQNLALLFQVIDGTADPLSTKPDPHLHWSYLRNNEWIDFTKDQVGDLTRGLTHSGIVTFAMPRDAADQNTLLPAGMHWIRAAVGSQSDAVCRLRMVAAQALEVTFENRENDPNFPAKTLDTGTIAKLAQPDADVKKVEQPFPTFGGRGQEDDANFYTRVSERLRHKDRAIALWDYERLVLEAFPDLYKAKCLNHTQYEPNDNGTGIYRELAPGHVTLVTVPNQLFHNLRDPLKPYTSLGLLLEVKAFLEKRLSCFVKLHVNNPQFEEVWTDFQVRFYEEFDETFYVNKLKQEITRFLSPWAYPGGGSPTFGGKIYKSVLINFIEDRPYVDFVTDFKLFHTYPDFSSTAKPRLSITSGNLNEVEGSTAVSILVSKPEKAHNIQVLNRAMATTVSEKCDCEA